MGTVPPTSCCAHVYAFSELELEAEIDAGQTVGSGLRPRATLLLAPCSHRASRMPKSFHEGDLRPPASPELSEYERPNPS